MDDVYIQMGSHTRAKDAAQYMDWGCVVEIHQGGVDLHVVGLDKTDAARVLRKAASALEEKT